MYRQGDVLIAEAPIPTTARFIPRRQNRARFDNVKRGIVLAAGEATGHHHVVTGAGARLFEEGGRRFLHVPEKGAGVVHEEHDTITLPAGDYEIRGQREYEPPAERASRPSTRRVYD